MLQMKVAANMTNKEIAQEMNVHPETVKRTLSWAKKAKITVEYEDAVLVDVVPMAIKALKSALEDGDGELAMKVLDKTIWAQQQQQKQTGKTENAHPDSLHDLAAYINQLRENAGEEDETIDGHITAERNTERSIDRGEIVGLIEGGSSTNDRGYESPAEEGILQASFDGGDESTIGQKSASSSDKEDGQSS
jgi:hypothetical protein